MIPYLTPTLLTTADTGIDWANLVPGHSGDSTAIAEQTRICWTATSLADTYCNQTLRATLDLEELYAPNDRAVLLPNGVLRCQVSRWPVLAVQSVQVGPFAQGGQLVLLPPTAYRVHNVSADVASAAGASAVDLYPGWVDWSLGRGGWIVQVSYLNGWPHAGLTATVATGATSLPVDDCTGMLAGTTVRIVDGGNTEFVTVSSASVVTGPGTLTLAAPTQAAHVSGTMVTALPDAIIQSCIDFAIYVAMTRGVSSVQIPPMHGVEGVGHRGGPDLALLDEAYARLTPFRRVL